LQINNTHRELLETTRKKLHANPELSGQEFLTQQFIIDFIKLHCKKKAVKVGGTGVIVKFEGKVKSKNILIRADIDALPIKEVNQFDHKSTFKSISHKCGHDGHTTMLLGLALKLTEQPILNGNIILLFQPSEENGKGAQSVLSDPYFKGLQLDYVYALHNLPGFPLHEIVIKENEFTSNVKSVAIKLHGKTAHAAEPEKGYNPAYTIAKILEFAAEKTNNNSNSEDFFLITPVHVCMGEKAYGISAGYGEVHMTIRSWSKLLMEKECINLIDYTNNLCQEAQLKPEITWLEEFYSNNNEKSAVRFIKEAALSNKLKVSEIATPFKWGEDFGLFTQQYKGAMFGLGAGENTPALHNPDYDFPDEITSTGINLFYKIIIKTIES
jgi:amidohydrolase